MQQLVMNNVDSSRSIHSTCVIVNGRGVLIIGKPNTGKSLIALSLLCHGHQLLSDDLTTLMQVEGKLFASCPPRIKNLLYVRKLGFINVAETFQHYKPIDQIAIDLVINLDKGS